MRWVLIAAAVPLFAQSAPHADFNKPLGVECAHCHDTPKLETARKMVKMVEHLNQNHLQGAATPVSCVTCHRGKESGKSAIPPELTKTDWPEALKLTPEQETKPAREVYSNMKSFGGMQAGRISRVMQMFRNSLGVNCDHCHVEGDYASEAKPQKDRARKMLRMVSSTPQFFDGKSTPVFCYTCHRGSAKPAV
jgi:hypothetical protein